MFKFIVSIYIFSVLFMAGSAKAADFMDLQRVKNSAMVPLQIDAADFDDQTGNLILIGNKNGFCGANIITQIIVNEEQNRVIITVAAKQSVCIIEEASEIYEVHVDLEQELSKYPGLNHDAITYKFMNSSIR